MKKRKKTVDKGKHEGEPIDRIGWNLEEANDALEMLRSALLSPQASLPRLADRRLKSLW